MGSSTGAAVGPSVGSAGGAGVATGEGTGVAATPVAKGGVDAVGETVGAYSSCVSVAGASVTGTGFS